MSVLIKGISMPKEPWDCPCHDGETGRCKVTANSCFPIPKDCPLVEVSTMSDLISRQEALDALRRDEEYDKDIPNRADGVRDAIITISNLPSATERKKAKWRNIDRQNVMCTECDFYFDITAKFLFSYCPNCGARMEVDDGKIH